MRSAALFPLLALLLLGCQPAPTSALDPALLPYEPAPAPGGTLVRVSEHGVVVQLNGPTVHDAFSELATQANVAVKVDEEVGVAHHLFLSFRAATPEQALRKLAKLSELRLDREAFGDTIVYRVGPPRDVFTLDPWSLLGAGLLLLGAFLTDRMIDVVLRRRERASRKGATRLKLLAPPLRVGVWLVSAIGAVLLVLNVPPSTALAVTGGGLLIVGLASKEMAANILSGLAIAMDRPLHLGDFVTVGHYRGEVTKIGLRSTQIVTLDDTTVTIPNSVVASDAVASANYGALEALILVEFHLGHAADVRRVRSIVWQGVVTSAYCSWKHPVHIVVTDELWSTRVVAHAYVFDVRHQLLFISDVTHRVKLAFAEAGIPYPNCAPARAVLADAPGSLLET